tara:strand:+ start:1526 stop:2836 length:1311 start_codon:yes stop_codon:yes gene_type:complete
VAVRFREWENLQGQESSGETSFILQTYLALLARLIARQFVAPRRAIANSKELFEVINVDYFSRRGIGNFGEGDIFSWLPLESRWELSLDDLVLETLRGLTDALASHDFTGATPGILDSLYRPTPPRWLAEYVVEEELGLPGDGLSLLDPSCGTGTFLCAAIGAMTRTLAEQGGDPIDVLFMAPEKFKGMDRDPLSVTLARLNYLLAFGDLVQQEHPPFLLPMYLADADSIPKSGSTDPIDPGVTLSTTAGDFPLPGPFIENPLMLDWVPGRLTNYMDGAQLRLHVQSEDLAVQEVLNAYYNYLTAAKPRTPVPDALTPQQADTFLETARIVVQLHIRGEGTLWLNMVQNLAAPAIFSHARFGRLGGQGSATLLETSSASYLRPSGRAAMVTSGDEAASAVVTGFERTVRLDVEGGSISHGSSWSDAKSGVRLTEES